MKYSGLVGTKQSLGLAREQDLIEKQCVSAGRFVHGGAGDTWITGQGHHDLVLSSRDDNCTREGEGNSSLVPSLAKAQPFRLLICTSVRHCRKDCAILGICSKCFPGCSPGLGVH